MNKNIDMNDLAECTNKKLKENIFIIYMPFRKVLES